MIKLNLNLENSKFTIQTLAALKEGEFEEGNDFSVDLNNELKVMLERLNVTFNIINTAIVREDWLAMLAFLVRTRVYLMNLSGVFSNTAEDIATLLKMPMAFSSESLSSIKKCKSSHLEDISVKIDLNLNEFKSIMKKINAFEQKVIETSSWFVNYELNLNEYFLEKINSLGGSIRVANKKLSSGEYVESVYHLKKICLFSMELSIFFDQMIKDVEKVIWSEEFNFPEFPEDYTIPEYYDLPESMR